jgi:hypothetical protein
MTPPTQTIYHLTGTKQHYYLIARLPGMPHGTFLANGQPMDKARDGHGGYGAACWYTTSHAVSTIEFRPDDRTITVDYKIKDPESVSARFPLTLTVEEWSDRTDCGDDEHAPEILLYQRITKTEPGETTPVDATIIDLDGEPAPRDGHTWTAKLPYELEHHVELLHLFPGHLTGFREALCTEVKRRLGVSDRVWGEPAGCTTTGDQRRTYVNAWRDVPYSPRQTEFRHDHSRSTGRALKSGRTVEKTARLSIAIEVGDIINGANRAEAVAKWNETITRLADEILAKLEPAVCWHCKGTGVVKAPTVEQHQRQTSLTAGSVKDAEQQIKAARDSIRALWRAGVEQLAQRDASGSETLAWLARQGCEDAEARKLVADVILRRRAAAEAA